MDKPKPKIEKSFMCERCGDEFPNLTEYKQHKSSCTGAKKVVDNTIEPEKALQNVAKKAVPQKKPKLPTEKPISLTYKYIGSCPQCGKDVDTLEMDVGDKYFTMAYCVVCKKQLQQKEVIKL